MSSFEKLKLLIWKNFLLQRRHKYQSLFEILSPVIFSLFLILVRCLVDPKSMPDVSYPAFQPTYFNMSARLLGNITKVSKEGTVAFSPENALTREVTAKAMQTVALDNINGFLLLIFNADMLPEPKGFKDAKHMERALTQPNAMSNILCGIQFDDRMTNATEWPDDINVTLRFPAVMRTPMIEHPIRASWRTNLLFPLFPRPGPRDPRDSRGGIAPGYSPEMFLAVQHAVSQEIIKSKSGQSVVPKVYLQRFPQLKYREDDLLVALERFISMIIMLCFAYPFVNTVRAITAEKELQLKETMKIMGLQSWLHWMAWFIKQFTYLFLSIIIMVLLLKCHFNRTESGEGYAVLTFTPWTVLLFFLTLFIMSSLAFSFMVSVFFSKANTAASFMGLAWFTTYSVYMLTQVLYEDISLSTKLTLSLISNTAMGYAFQMIVMCEGTSRGLQWSDFFKPISYHDQFQPGHIVLMFILDTILYTIIAMYVEKIRPGAYGVPLPWYFPLTKNFWASGTTKIAAIPSAAGETEYADALLKVVHDEEPKGVPVGVNIQNLTKIYRGRKKAVDNLSLRMYENEITVLLGHNGAGKTTTISMLTGMVYPTSGAAKISGYDIVSDTESARKSLGLCPQHNVLFPDLTVSEHIIFYSRLKGVPKDKITSEVSHFLKLLELEEKRDVQSCRLSGGQQRRLSVGAAMCGSSRVVLLDEPTSGLDPAARRALWDLLQKEKRGRTIILTTHFMDEADVLGDRIAIMAGGRLQCVGTPYFLKKHYGIGYKLTIVKKPNCIVTQCTEFIKSYVPDLKENTDIGSELTYILPNESVSRFPAMLKDLEQKKDWLLISSYGLTITSLEEVFMKAGAEDFVDGAKEHKFGKSSGVSFHKNGTIEMPPDIGDMDDIHKVRGFRLLGNHIKAMFLKLIYGTTRNKLQNIIQFFSPIINISLSVIIARSWKFISDLPALELSLESGFRKTQTLMSYDSSFGNDSMMEYNSMLSYRKIFYNSTYPGLDVVDLGNGSVTEFYENLSKEDLSRVRYENLIGATFSPSRIIGWFSNFGYHDSAISLSMVNNAILQAVSPGSSLHIINHPLPYSIENLVRVMASGSSMGFQFAFNIGFCMAFVTSFIVLFVIKERRSGAKLLQHVSGVRPAIMWGCALVWDWLWLFLIHLCTVATLACFQENTFSTVSELGRVLLVLMVYSLATIPVHYLASFYFEAAASGFSKMCFINMFIGCMPFLITEVLRLPEVGSPYYARLFDWIFSPLPIYCLSRSFRDMSMTSFAILACDGLCDQYVNIANCTRDVICNKLSISVCCVEDNPFLQWHEPGISRYLFMMTMVGIVSFTILLVKEYELVNKVFYLSRSLPPAVEPCEEDSDVISERNAVHNVTRAQMTNYSLMCKDLTKYYNNFLAVNRLSFAVRKGECFGLLGINGAGKTTTFRMLTGDTRISSGDAYVHGHSIKTNLQDTYRNIGYCPQFDGLLDNLTGRETLRIFCLLRGIPANIGRQSAEALTRELGFMKHFDKKVHQYSGGTKRKLSTALALLGDASLLFLDEPTTGMDPASKRLVWGSISAAVNAGRSVVLTSHSMEECEALCSRLTVMVAGRLHCLGPLQHLKNKFSQGYTLIVKCKLGPERDAAIAAVNDYVTDEFHDAKLIETYLGMSTYYVSDVNLPWWRIFDIMEVARIQLPIEDYSVSQTTLEQVFLRFTRIHANKED